MLEQDKYVDALAEYIKTKLYPYQKKWIADKSRFRIANKSRQIGYSYVIALDIIIGALLRVKNQLVISSSLDNAEIVGDYVREHLESMSIPIEQDSTDKIKLFNGKKIRFLATNWRTARGFNGDIWFDEFAFTLQDSKIWTALVPSITAVGGRISVVSTPKSRIDKYWQLWENGKSFSKHCTTIYDAVKDGFPVNIEELRDLFSPEEFAQAFECIPLDTTDSYIPYDLIQPCIELDLESNPLMPGWYRHHSAKDNEMDLLLNWNYGVDIGRTKDITSIIGAVPQDPYTELCYMQDWKRKIFQDQKAGLQVLLADPRTMKMGIDRGGIGMNLHEDLQFAYPSKVMGYNFAPAVKERLAKFAKKLFEEQRIRIPNDPTLIQHILSIKRKPTKTNIFSYDTEDKTHHADRFWALAMACDCGDNRRVIDNVKVF